MTHNEQTKRFMFRRQILDELSLSGPKGLAFEALYHRVSRMAFGSAVISKDDFINGHLSALINQGMAQCIPDTLCPDLYRYALTEKGKDYLHGEQTTQKPQQTPASSEAAARIEPGATPKHRSAVLRAIGKALKALWTFFIWLFTEII
ncbi:MAG: hypothetical protein ACPGSB_03475 [Opitutales bacterium]